MHPRALGFWTLALLFPWSIAAAFLRIDTAEHPLVTLERRYSEGTEGR